ncbi:MAG: hypothetical protein KBS85_04165 [Lachnospiraceae bacterium]|nr:hypothetical protein [Candidatus Merdinaster equi]
MANDEGISQLIQEYRTDIQKLSKYIPWLETKTGNDVESNYNAGGEGGHTVSFPVFDSTLLAFVRDAQETVMMNENYVYTYSRNGFKTSADELAFINNATIKDIQALGDILSKYVLMGRYKSRMWTEGVQNRIFIEVLLKLKYLVEFWDKPLA